MPKHSYIESKIIRDIATIMAKNPDVKEWTRKKLAEKLSEIPIEVGKLCHGGHDGRLIEIKKYELF